MINKRLIWTVIFNTDCAVVEVLPEAWVGEVNEGFVAVFVVNVRDGAVFDTFSGVQVDATIDVVSEIGVEVLTDVNANVLVVAMTALQFAMPTP